MKKIKWIVLPYIVMGICIAIGLVIGMAPELLGDVIPRHGGDRSDVNGCESPKDSR